MNNEQRPSQAETEQDLSTFSLCRNWRECFTRIPNNLCVRHERISARWFAEESED